MTTALTSKMHKTLNVIRLHIAANGISPTHQEIADELGLASKSGVHERLRRLENHGAIRRLPHRARGIELVKRTCPHCGKEL